MLLLLWYFVYLFVCLFFFPHAFRFSNPYRNTHQIYIRHIGYIFGKYFLESVFIILWFMLVILFKAIIMQVIWKEMQVLCHANNRWIWPEQMLQYYYFRVRLQVTGKILNQTSDLFNTVICFWQCVVLVVNAKCEGTYCFWVLSITLLLVYVVLSHLCTGSDYVLSNLGSLQTGFPTCS